MSLKWFLILFFLIVLIAGAPIFAALGAALVADYYGCTLDAASVHPCLINGTDYGHALLTVSMLAWFGMVTLPYGVIALVLLIGLAAIMATVKFLRGRAYSGEDRLD